LLLIKKINQLTNCTYVAENQTANKTHLGHFMSFALKSKINGISEYLKSILETLKGLQRKLTSSTSIKPTTYDFLSACLKTEKLIQSWFVHTFFIVLSQFLSAYFLPNKNHTCGTKHMYWSYNTCIEHYLQESFKAAFVNFISFACAKKCFPVPLPPPTPHPPPKPSALQLVKTTGGDT
jgi:hypothetical protein